MITAQMNPVRSTPFPSPAPTLIEAEKNVKPSMTKPTRQKPRRFVRGTASKEKSSSTCVLGVSDVVGHCDFLSLDEDPRRVSLLDELAAHSRAFSLIVVEVTASCEPWGSVVDQAAGDPG